VDRTLERFIAVVVVVVVESLGNGWANRFDVAKERMLARAYLSKSQ